MVCRRSNVNSILEPGSGDGSLEAAVSATNESGGRLEHLEGLLEQWVIHQDHLPNNYDRNLARSFVRGAKCKLDAAKKKFEGHFLAKYAFPQYYTGRDPTAPHIQEAMEHVTIAVMPKLTEAGDRIWVMSLTSNDPADFDLNAVIKLFLMIFDLVLTCDCPFASELMVFDCANFTPAHFVKFIGPALRHVLNITKDGYAIRLKEVHVINASGLIDRLLSTIKPFIHEKVRKRFLMHRSLDTLLEALPSKVLPEDFGGDLANTRQHMNKLKELLIENAAYLREQENVKLLGKPGKRIEKFKSEELEGSFRQLSID